MSTANYDLNEVFDALAALFNGIETGDEIGGVPVTMEAHSEFTGSVSPPAILLDLDDQDWDLDMGHGADSFQITALVLVTAADEEGAQRALRSFLSRKTGSGFMRIKERLESDQTLGGLVSYAIMATVRNSGLVTYQGIEYLGAELIIGVTS
jgi:hypothetical protein